MSVVETIQKIAEEKRVSIKELADKTGVSYKSLKGSSRNKGNLKKETIEKICSYFGITQDELFNNDFYEKIKQEEQLLQEFNFDELV